MDEARLATALTGLLGKDLAEELVGHFIKIRRDLATKTLERASAGKFVEIFVQGLEHMATGKHHAKPDVDDYLDKKAENASLPDGLRISAARIARAIYTLRNKRNIAHRGGVDPNSHDLAFCHDGARWIMAELVRNAQGITMEEAGTLIAQVQAPVGALVEDVNGTRLIHAEGIRAELLILLHSHYPQAVPKDHGSFFVGGEVKQAEPGDLGAGRAAGQYVANQMYVQYMIPQGGGQKMPVVMVHGGGLSGKSYETTPDGRMGWADYFVRQGHAVYLPDQISRARSGFDPTVFNKVRDGRLPNTALSSINRTSMELGWDVFRFGPTFPVPFPDEQFPVEAAVDFSKQGVPDFSFPATPNPNYRALADLAIKVKGAVIMGHSQSGAFPLQTALTDPTGTKGLIVMEGVCTPASWSDAQIATLATIPILVVFGDHLTDAFGGVWQTRFNDCQTFITRINAGQ